ncbi:MAG: hypothetical protein K8R46_06110 [Pirellulales bacterium]|nr:hypothetical protein [Pirellulales bacterium]
MFSRKYQVDYGRPACRKLTMLLTITSTHRPATDLGYLLHKHPARFGRNRKLQCRFAYADGDLHNVIELSRSKDKSHVPY